MAKKKKSKRGRKNSEILSAETKKGIFIILIFLIALLALLALLNLAGAFGIITDQILGMILGWGKWIFPLLLLMWGYFLLNPDKYLLKPSNYLGLFFVILAYSGLLELIHDFNNLQNTFTADQGGGYIGYAITQPLQQAMGGFASFVILLGLLLISILISFNISLDELGNKVNIFRLLWLKIKSFSFNRSGKDYEEDYEEEEEYEEDDYEEDEDEEDYEEEEDEEVVEEKTNKKESSDNELIEMPKPRKKAPKVKVPIDLLDKNGSEPTSGDIDSSAEKIRKTFENFNIEVTMGEANIGPTVTQFTFKPADGIKLSQITALDKDIALALAAKRIRIEAPIPGKSLVGVEVPNKKVAVVKLREIIESDSFQRAPKPLVVALGKDVSGESKVTYISKMPHCLIAGATGSGKSVCLNAFIVSLLYKYHPDELKFIMVDPKRVELSVYNNIPHLLTPIITEIPKTINALRWAVSEMEERYKLLQSVGKKDIESYNSSVLVNRMPYLVIIIDELAELMVINPKDVEPSIIRLAQLARAVGIHLIIATQRPSTNVITGLIKANITTRIAFSVASNIDSRTIIDSPGAEKLLGNGDMLYTSSELPEPRRLQGAFVSEKEINNVVNFWKEQGEPEYDEAIVERQKIGSMPGGTLGGGNDEDELLTDAQEVVVKAGKASASLLQRRLRVGYARAASLLDMLEEKGIVGPPNGAKPREVLLRQEDLEENLDMREYTDEWEDDDSDETSENEDSGQNKDDEYNEEEEDK
ncbi:MAG: DNA translocase FtsK 4TM domain-containing protein [Candidatus Komeilibacteria bacterium]